MQQTTQTATSILEVHQGWVFAAFTAYLIVVIGLGIYASRFSSSGIGEFFIGGRKLGRLVVALSAVVSGRSAWLVLGLSGMAWKSGVSALWAALGYIAVECVLFLSFAGRLRRFSEKYDAITIPDFLAARFNDRGFLLRGISVLVILVFLSTYVAGQLLSGGKALAPTFGLADDHAVLVTAAVVLAYTVLGGFLAVSLTDLVQAFVMMIALVVLPVVATISLGGVGAVWEQLRGFDLTLVDPMALGMGATLGLFAIGLGSPGQPHILARYMAIRDPDQLRYAAVVGTLWNVVMAAGAIWVGLAGRAMFSDAASLPGSDPEKLYLLVASQQLHPALFGFVVASVFAAIMSTADSQVLVCASSVVRDLYQQVFARGREVSERTLVRLSRIMVVLVVLLSLLMGYMAEKVVFWLVLFAWAGLGAALGPVGVLSLYWKRTTRAGVMVGIVVGAATTMIWKQIPYLKAMIYELVPGVLLATVATIVVSLLTRPPTGVDAMFRVMREGPEE